MILWDHIKCIEVMYVTHICYIFFNQQIQQSNPAPFFNFTLSFLYYFYQPISENRRQSNSWQKLRRMLILLYYNGQIQTFVIRTSTFFHINHCCKITCSEKQRWHEQEANSKVKAIHSGYIHNNNFFTNH